MSHFSHSIVFYERIRKAREPPTPRGFQRVAQHLHRAQQVATAVAKDTTVGVVGVAVAVAAYRLAQWWVRFRSVRRVPKKAEKMSAELIRSREIEGFDLDEEEWGEYGTPHEGISITIKVDGVPVNPTRPGTGILGNWGVPRRNKAALRASAYVRSKIGLPTRTQANELVAGRLIRDFLCEKGMRPSHILATEPIALELVFTPTATDIRARQVGAARATVEMREAHQATYYTRMGGVFGLFRRRVETAPPQR